MQINGIKYVAGILRNCQNLSWPIAQNVCSLAAAGSNYRYNMPPKLSDPILYLPPRGMPVNQLTVTTLNVPTKLAKVVDGCGKKEKEDSCDKMSDPPLKSPCDGGAAGPDACEPLPCSFPTHPGICDGKVFPKEEPPVEKPSDRCGHEPPCPHKKKTAKPASQVPSVSYPWLTSVTIDELLILGIKKRSPMLFAKDAKKDDCGEKKEKPCKNAEHKPCSPQKKEKKGERMPCSKTKAPCPPLPKPKKEEPSVDPCASMYHKKCPPRTSKGDCEKPIVDPCAPKGCQSDDKKK